MNFFFKTILCALLAVCTSGAWCAQGKTDVFVLGKDKGSVDSLKVKDVLYLDIQKTARKLGVGVELFAQAKQAKLSMKGFYAILTAPLADIIINAQTKTLSNPVIAYQGKIMVPAEFFELSAFQNALDRVITFDEGKMQVEKRFNLAYADNKTAKQAASVWLETKGRVSYQSQELNKHTVQVSFSDAVLKRDLFLRVKNDFIRSVEIRQGAKTTPVLEIILGKEAKVWDIVLAGETLVFRAGASKAALTGVALAKEVAGQDVLPEPSLKEENPIGFDEAEEMVFGSSPKISAASGTLTPSVMTEGPASASAVPVLSAANSASADRTPKAKKKMRIVLDPGHGGKDGGASRKKYREKNWNLAVGKELYKLLKKGNFEVKLTRDDDTFVALSQRSKIANDFKADLFVSIHTNAARNTRANGFQVYFRSEKATDGEAADVAAFENEALQYEDVHYNFVDALLQSLAKNEYINESSKLAGHVRNRVVLQPGIGIAVNRNSSVRQANFYVLKGVNSPAILVEMGYISNAKDRARLSSSSVQKKMAEGIYKGIYHYAAQEGWIE